MAEVPLRDGVKGGRVVEDVVIEREVTAVGKSILSDLQPV